MPRNWGGPSYPNAFVNFAHRPYNGRESAKSHVIDKEPDAGAARPVKTLKIVLNLGLAALLFWFLARYEQKMRTAAASRDSMSYWAAGKLLVHRQNPYSVADVQRLESGQGYAGKRPLMMRTPPWSVWMTLPEGVLNSYWAWVMWEALLLASLVTSMRISWRLYGDGPRPPKVFVLTGYIFAPVAACLAAGQVGMILLLGITAFFLLEKDHPFWAGAALLLPMAKPHIFMPIWLVLALWVLREKRWALLGGAAAAFLMANCIGLAFDPGIFGHYREMLHQQAIQNEFIPSLSGVIRALFFRRFFWVQFVPMGLGLLWSLWFYWKNRSMWNWPERGLTLLIACVLATPYSWMTDEVVVVPAILQGVLWLHRAKLGWGSRGVILIFVLLDSLLLLMLAARIPLTHASYFWSSVVWCCWYFYAKSFARPASEQQQSAPARAYTVG